jgi:hypothetical protein
VLIGSLVLNEDRSAPRVRGFYQVKQAGWKQTTVPLSLKHLVVMITVALSKNSQIRATSTGKRARRYTTEEFRPHGTSLKVSFCKKMPKTPLCLPVQQSRQSPVFIAGVSESVIVSLPTLEWIETKQDGSFSLQFDKAGEKILTPPKTADGL